MNVRKMILIALWVASGALRTHAEEPTWVTARQLLRAPREFDRKQVCALGYFDGSRLFANFKAAKDSKHTRLSLAVDQSTFINPETPSNPAAPIPGVSPACDLKNRYVRIIGTFQCGDYRSDKPCPCEITHIVYFRATRKSPDTKIRPCGMYHRQ